MGNQTLSHFDKICFSQGPCQKMPLRVVAFLVHADRAVDAIIEEAARWADRRIARRWQAAVPPS